MKSFFMFQLIAFLLLFTQSISQQYQIPPLSELQDKNMRLNQIQQLNQPLLNLQKIYKRQVYQTAQTPNDNTNFYKPSTICKQQPPEVTFNYLGYYGLSQINSYGDVLNSTNANKYQNHNIIYDFDILKTKYRNIIDMLYYDDYVFTISSTAVIFIYKVNRYSDNFIQLVTTIKAIDWAALNQKRMNQWKQAQEREKNRLNQTSKNPLLGQEISNSSLLGKDTSDNSSLEQEIKGNSTVRLLQQSLVKNSSNTTTSNNQTEQKYYTGPPPESLIPHLSKGFFQLIDNNQTLIFVNNEFLIALQVRTFKVTLLSQQQQYEVLMMERNKKIEDSNSTNSTNSINSINSTNSNNSANATNSSNSINSTNSSNTSNDTSTSTEQNKNQTIIGMIPPKIPEYKRLNNFQSVTKINDKYFAIADRKTGVYIYELVKYDVIDNKTKTITNSQKLIKLVKIIDKDQFIQTYYEDQQMNLIDIEYNQNKSLLLVLDYQKGIFSFDITVINSTKQSILNSTNKTNQTSSQLAISFNFGAIYKKMCTLMQFSQIQQNLYLACNKIFRINIEKWPIITQKVFPHPLIHIRQIFVQQNKNMFVLAGYSVFKVIYLDRTTNYFQDDMLDKIIFTDDLTITANQNHIIVLKYQIAKPTIVCSTHNQSELGTHHMILRTTAQCSQQYLNSINYKKSYNQSFKKDDVCVYTVFKNLYIWKVGQVPLKPLGIIGLIFLIFIVVMIIWFILVKLRMRRARQYLKYLGSQGHKQLEQQNQKQQGNNKKQKSKQYNVQTDNYIQTQNLGQVGKESNKTQQQQINKELYDIQ